MNISDNRVFLTLPPPFGFYCFILNCDHLHFGLWPEDNATVSIEDAQENMFNYLLSFFPPPPAKVLDVGCGLGLSAFYISQKGYKVTAIAPSPEMIDYAKQKYGDRVEFKVLNFFDEDEAVFSPGLYDVIFLQESAQYLDSLNEVFKKARQLLKDKGSIILGDEVCYDRSIKPETAVHLSSDFAITFAENGFRITEHQKIGKLVFPTCDFIIKKFTENFDRVVSESNKPDTREKLLLYLNGWKKQKSWYEKGQMGYEIFVARKDNFFMKSYAQSDEYNILPMFNKVFHVSRTLNHWYWKFRDNPYGSYKISVASSEEGVLVAHYAGYSVPFYFSLDKRKNFLSYQIGDTMTSPDVRNVGRGRTGILARMSYYFYAKFCEGHVPFIYGFNTANIKKLGMRCLGYTYIDPVTLWVKDIAKDPFKPLSRIKRLFSGYSVKEIHSISDEWDVFFDRVCDFYIFLVRRDSTYLKWRYLECPDRIHRIFAVYKRGNIVGWSVFVEKEKKIIWGDALFDSRYLEAAKFMLSSLFTKEFSGYECIEGWFPQHPEWWVHQLKRLGFTPTDEPNNLTPGFVIFEEPIRLEKLKNYFYYTIGDSDLF
jgi:SAM-dependent methyltransferase